MHVNELLTVLVVGIVGGVAPSVAHASSSTHVSVLFSENDELCMPLARLYEQLSKIHHYAEPEGMVETQFGLSWEDEYAPQFKAIGLEQPQPLNDAMYPFSPALSEDNALVANDGAHVHFTASLRADYRVDLVGNGKPQIVRVEDVSIGGHGAFGTNVWILKSGREVEADADAWLLPDVVDLGVFFGGMREDEAIYRHIMTPYFFDKIASRSERALSVAVRARKEDPSIAPPTVIQRLFRFKGSYYVTARQIGTPDALVYRYHGQQRIDDVCYLMEPHSAKRTRPK